MAIFFPINLFNIATYRSPVFSTPVFFGRNGRVANVSLDWTHIYTTQAVYLNFRQQAYASNILDRLVMAYIDNSANSNNIYVYFNDTQQILTVFGGEIGYFPLLTSTLECIVFNGINGSIATLKGSTQLQFCNFETPGFANVLPAIIKTRVSSLLGSQQVQYSVPSVSNTVSSFSNTWVASTFGTSTTITYSLFSITKSVVVTGLQILPTGLNDETNAFGSFLDFEIYQAGFPSGILGRWGLTIGNASTPNKWGPVDGAVLINTSNISWPLLLANGNLTIKFTKQDTATALDGTFNINLTYG